MGAKRKVLPAVDMIVEDLPVANIIRSIPTGKQVAPVRAPGLDMLHKRLQSAGMIGRKPAGK